jgi:hypothetical protein
MLSNTTLGMLLAQQPGVNADVLTGQSFFPYLISGDDGDRRAGVTGVGGPLRYRERPDVWFQTKQHVAHMVSAR